MIFSTTGKMNRKEAYICATYHEQQRLKKQLILDFDKMPYALLVRKLNLIPEIYL